MRRETGYFMYPYIYNSVNSPPDVGNEVSRCMRRENRLLQSCIHLYSYTCNSVKLTAWCWQCMKWADEERRKQVNLVMHPCINNLVKLTAWCWQWSTQMRRETGYFMHPYIHNSVNSPPDVGNEVSRCMRRENRLLRSCIHLYSYMQFRKTHPLMLAMH